MAKHSCCIVCQGIVYKDEYDATLRTGVRSRKGVEDVLTYNVIKDAVSAVLEQLEKESLPAGATHAPAIATGATSTSGAAPAATEGEAPDAAENKAVREGLGKMAEGTREHWESIATRLVRQYTRIVVTPSTEAGLVQEIEACELARTLRSQSGLFLLHYDVKLSGEPMTAPKLRVSPFQEKSYSKIVSSVLQARWQGPAGSKPALNAGDLVVLLDAGRGGNEKAGRLDVCMHLAKNAKCDSRPLT